LRGAGDRLRPTRGKLVITPPGRVLGETERGLRACLRDAADLIGLVQLSDYIAGRRDPYRAVPGDGVIGLERILAAVLEDGYAGLFDLELYAEPGVDPADTIARACDYAGAMLERLGA
jgi:sugar phosphate isomerase/epimerase